MNRLGVASQSGNTNAAETLADLAPGAVPESFAVTAETTGEGGMAVHSLQGITGVPTATVESGLPSVSPIASMLGTWLLTNVTQAATQK